MISLGVPLSQPKFVRIPTDSVLVARRGKKDARGEVMAICVETGHRRGIPRVESLGKRLGGKVKKSRRVGFGAM